MADWKMKGQYLKNCNCLASCPCDTIGIPAPNNFCEGIVGMNVQEGYFDGVDLSGTKWAANLHWPGALHEGNGTAEIFVDESASEAQRNALLTILFLSDTYAGRVNDKRIANATPYPLPAGSQLLQDLGFLAFTLPQVEILMPTKKLRGQELTLEQHLANQALHHRRLRIEHVNSSVKRCRIVKDRLRLWKKGIRDVVMEICCALHNFRVRLTPWQPMI